MLPSSLPPPSSPNLRREPGNEAKGGEGGRRERWWEGGREGVREREGERKKGEMEGASYIMGHFS